MCFYHGTHSAFNLYLWHSFMIIKPFSRCTHLSTLTKHENQKRCEQLLTEWRVRPIKTRRPSCGLSSSIFTSLHGCICILRKDSRSPLLHQPHDILNTIVTCVEWEECSSSNKAAHSNLQRHVHYFTFITSRSRWQHSQEDHGLLYTNYTIQHVSLSP